MAQQLLKFAVVILLVLAGAGCSRSGDVVLYCSQDQEHAEAILKSFEQTTGMRVQIVYDTEAVKSVELVQKIVEERSNTRCDVFWNNEPLNTIFLKNEGLLAPYSSTNAGSIPAAFKDREGYWTGFAARARILIVNDKALGADPRPSKFTDLADPKWKGRCVMAKPIAGTTATHMCVLFDVMGEAQLKGFLESLVKSGFNTAAGNAHVMRQVRDGTNAWGFTDTDDYYVAKTEGYPVSAIYPDQEEGGTGTLVLPNTVALIKGAPHPEAAKKLIDYLLSDEVEKRLAAGRSAQIPLHPGIPHPDHIKVPGVDFRPMNVDFDKTALKRNERFEYLQKMFVQ